MHYVEASALPAELVQRAEQWPWGSLYAREKKQAAGLRDDWPAKRPANWVGVVNSAAKKDEIDILRTSVNRARAVRLGEVGPMHGRAPRPGLHAPRSRTVAEEGGGVYRNVPFCISLILTALQ